MNRIFGRADFVAELTEWVRGRRLVTVVGPGGIGKTSVALAVARRVAPLFSDGVSIVELARVAERRLAPTALASALGKPVRAKDPLPELLEFLCGKQMLVVLDNCEHVVDAAAESAERITRAAPRVNVLATSREPLRAVAESVARLPPLDVPPRLNSTSAAAVLEFPSVQLFLDRARLTRSDFEYDDSIAPFVADICRRLDGIPLAIELAARRVDAFSARELASLLDERFRVLTSGRRSALPRHRTLSAAFDWSYDLLSTVERAVLRRLSVFIGAIPMEAAVAVASDETVSAAEVVEIVAPSRS